MSTYNFNFYLEKPQADIEANLQKETTIVLFCRRKQHLLKYRTPFILFPSQWDGEKREVKRNKVGYSSVNSTLDKIRTTAQTYFFECLNEGKPFLHYGLKEKLDTELGLKSAASAMTLYSFLDMFIVESKVTKAPNTIKSYSTTYSHLKAFGKTVSLPKNVDFTDVTLNYYYQLVAYLGNTKKMALNSIGKNIKNLKVFMGESYDRGLHRNDIFKSKKFKVLKEDTDAIYLTEEELGMIKKLDLSQNLKLDRVRDIFLVGCYTGLRFSDLERLTKSNITGDFKYIEIVPKKTKGISPETISIPIFDQVRDIFQKYLKQGEKILPPILSNQKMNDYIKDVGEEAKITYPHRYEQRVGNQTVVVETAKYKLITTHTARRSFATNAYLRPDVKPFDIMAITGHKTESAFMRYIKMSNKDAADRLRVGWKKVPDDKSESTSA